MEVAKKHTLKNKTTGIDILGIRMPERERSEARSVRLSIIGPDFLITCMGILTRSGGLTRTILVPSSIMTLGF
jgi:hypothetical protein